jgi:hypothetical protein
VQHDYVCTVAIQSNVVLKELYDYFLLFLGFLLLFRHCFTLGGELAMLHAADGRIHRS